MRFPDPNIGYVFGYRSTVTDRGVLVTFLGGIVRILFKYSDIARAQSEKYFGGRISWDVVRWGKCPTGTQALRITLRHGIVQGTLKDHFIVFDDLERAILDLRSHGVVVN